MDGSTVLADMGGDKLGSGKEAKTKSKNGQD